MNVHIHIPSIGRLYDCYVRRVLLHFHIGIITIVCILCSYNYEKILVIYLEYITISRIIYAFFSINTQKLYNYQKKVIRNLFWTFGRL